MGDYNSFRKEYTMKDCVYDMCPAYRKGITVCMKFNKGRTALMNERMKLYQGKSYKAKCMINRPNFLKTYGIELDQTVFRKQLQENKIKDNLAVMGG